jgi:hypothetical protein
MLRKAQNIVCLELFSGTLSMTNSLLSLPPPIDRNTSKERCFYFIGPDVSVNAVDTNGRQKTCHLELQ